MTELRRCTKCVMNENWPGISFNSEGICNICTEYKKYIKIDWRKREVYLKHILKTYKGLAWDNQNKYDCIVGYSGGKDTAYTLWAMKKKYGMTPLAVTWDHGFKLSPEAEYNMMEIPKILDVDHLRFTIGGGLRNALCRRASEVMGDFCWHCHNGVGAFPARVSKMMNIPLQVWGEPTALYSTGGAFTLEDFEEQDKEHFEKVFQANVTPEMVLPFEYHLLDLQPMTWPDEEFHLKAIYLGNFELWNQRNNVDIITKELGWKHKDSENTWCDWDKVDCEYELVRDYQKFIRRGFGRASFQASKDIREGLIGRSRALELVEKYEGKVPSNMDKFCLETGISKEEFSKITSKKI